MKRCTDYQELLLEYLYDLMEPEDQGELQAHLKSCPDCQSSLKEAERQKSLLGQAALLEFSSVRFTAPDAEMAPAAEAQDPIPAEPVVLSVADRRAGQGRSGSWQRWAVAALILLTLGVPGWIGWDYLGARQEIARQESERQHFWAMSQQKRNAIAGLEQKRQAKLQEVDEKKKEKLFHLELSGPTTYKPGARNEYQIHTYNGKGKKVPAKIVAARVLDEKQKVLYEETEITSRGDHKVQLPADLPLKPHTDLSLEVVAIHEGDKSVVREKLPLAAPVYLSYLTTDKPMYQPGEAVRFRSLTLERFSLKPSVEPFDLVFSLRDPRGRETVLLSGGNGVVTTNKQNRLTVVKGPDDKILRGVGGGEHWLSPDLEGGEYALILREANDLFQPQERKFLVNRYQKPQLSKTLDFQQKSYGPGDELIATGRAVLADNEKETVAHRPVEATLLIDDQMYDQKGNVTSAPVRLMTDLEGEVLARFQLPKTIQKGNATLSLNFLAKSGPEAIHRPVPLVLKQLLVDFYPEGGDLVAGVPNRVYFQSRTTLGKPADFEGEILNGNKVVARIRTENDEEEQGVNRGLGTFVFTPKSGERYRLKVTTPIGIDPQPELPEVRGSGVVLSIPQAVTTSFEPIELTLRNVGPARSLLVGAYCRGRLLDHKTVSVPAGSKEITRVTLKPQGTTGGVYRITVFEKTPGGEKRLVPLAERLVYRAPGERLTLDLATASQQYLPRDRVQLRVGAKDENQQPTPAIVLLQVVDNRVLTLADEKTDRSQPTHFYLTSELHKPSEIEHGDFLLTNHPKAPLALDLLLGTQGWRRFAEQDPESFQQKHPEEARRFLADVGLSQETLLLAHAENREQVEEWRDQARLEVAQSIENERQKLRSELSELERKRTAPTESAYLAATAKVARYHDFFRKVRAFWPVVGLVLVVAILFFVLSTVKRSGTVAIPWAAASVVCLVLLLGGTALIQSELSSHKAGVTREVAQKNMAPDRAGPGGRWMDGGPRDNAAGAKDDAPPMPGAGGLGFAGGGGGLEGGFGGGVPGAFPPGAPPGPELPDAKGDGSGFGGAPEEGANLDSKKEQGGADPDANLRKSMKKATNGYLSRLRQQAQRELQKNLAQAQRFQGILQMARPSVRINRGLEKGSKGGKGEGKGGRGAKGGEDFPGAGKPGGMPGRHSVPLYVREYAHQASWEQVRSDDTETVYWHPVLVLPEGEATVSFHVSDSITTYKVTAYGHTLDGRLGAGSTTFSATLPFAVTPKSPLEVTSDDKIAMPVTVANKSKEARDVRLKFSRSHGLALEKGEEAERLLQLEPKTASREIYRLQPTLQSGRASVIFTGEAKPFAADAAQRTIQVVPQGFPYTEARSEVLEQNAREEITLPSEWVPGTLRCRIQVFPSTLADLQQGLEGLLREPHGCFEQTSTSNYPNVLILEYLRQSDQSKPQLESRARRLLDRGYKKLTSFECLEPQAKSRRGYEWFGGTAPPHEALTAYGLLQFRDMAKVHKVDPTMVDRTRQYLMGQRDGKGSFKRNTRALDSFGRAPAQITDAYIVWALTESGNEDDVSKELDALQAKAKDSKDPYFLSLVANSLMNRGKKDEGTQLLQRIAAMQKKEGELVGESTSITSSRGRDLKIETTALAVLGWLKADRGTFREPIQKAIRWLGKQRGGYGAFGSTQATILALKALISYTQLNKRPQEAGELSLFVGERKVATLPFSAETSDVLTLEIPDAEKHLKPGTNVIHAEVTGKNVFPYTLSWSYRTLKPLSDKKLPVLLKARLDRAKVQEGDTVRLTATVENVSGKGQGMAVAILGLPGGMTIPEDLKQLKQHITPPAEGGRSLVSAFEIRGRELILYWRGLAPNQKIEVPIDLICRVPGEYSGPASRAYLYYNADHKHWIDPLKVAIEPRETK